jgi:signal transduction histidine kinase
VPHAKSGLGARVRIWWTDLTPPDWRGRNDLRIETHKSSGRFPPFEKEYMRKDGTRVLVLIGEATFEEGGNHGVAFVLDWTERKRAEDALREEQERLRQLESELAHLNRLSMMGQLAASLVHEIAQPCASARNDACAALNFLGEQPPDLGEVKDALGYVEHLARVFEAFYTTKSSGVGMGLSICRSIIDAHGGRLWAEANEPRGAVFQFTLPGAERTHELSSGGSPEWTATR